MAKYMILIYGDAQQWDGYYLLEAADLDEVIALATQLPEVHAQRSGVEIRPVVDHG